MGASFSTEKPHQYREGLEEERREEESHAASIGALPILQNAFSKLSLPRTNAVSIGSLEEVFSLNFASLQAKSFRMSESFPGLVANLGSSIIDLFFRSDEEGISWVGFLRGYNRCSGRMPVSESLNVLFRLYSVASRRADNITGLEFDSDGNGGKITGSLLLNDVLLLLWMCWIMGWASRIPKFSKEKLALVLPDICNLISSVFISCNEVGRDYSIENYNTFDLETVIPAQRLNMWILTTVPGLAHCISQYIQGRLQASTASGDDTEPSTSSFGDDLSVDVNGSCLLTRGRAWAISLCLRSVTDELLEACFSQKVSGALDNLLYRSSIHGKGLNRFWSNVEGYHGPLLILVSASSVDSFEDDRGCKNWVIAILTGQGFENLDTFYGSTGQLFSIDPIFHAFPASGKGKNFMYCHLRPAGSVYDPHPKPVGVAFGGTVGNERIFMDEDFAKVVIRHHAVDKTYQPGHLVPNQGFLPTNASVVDVEVWGLGGKAAKVKQDAYKKRESLFSEQRRKVDLKTFGNWEDSPEKMMMDMVSDPNKVQREDR